MNRQQSTEQLFEYASACKFREFDEALGDLERNVPAEDLREAYLMRAQIKLFAADVTLLEDLEKAQPASSPLKYPCLGLQWKPDSPNRFVVFPQTAGGLHFFLQALPEAAKKLKRLYGDAGVHMIRQIQSEILYFLGMPDESLKLAEQQYKENGGNQAGMMLAQYVLFRDRLALGSIKDTEQSMIDMVRMAETSPECQKPYRVIREWANLTTGWSGDSPRFQNKLPVLDDRLAAIKKGISRPSFQEKAFMEYAKGSYGETGTVSRFYMEIFQAVHWFYIEEFQQAQLYFAAAYRTSDNTGLLMPFAEYGKQIIPLLQFIRESEISFSQDWLAKVLSLAIRYEKNLDAYRS